MKYTACIYKILHTCDIQLSRPFQIGDFIISVLHNTCVVIPVMIFRGCYGDGADGFLGVVLTVRITRLHLASDRLTVPSHPRDLSVRVGAVCGTGQRCPSPCSNATWR